MQWRKPVPGRLLYDPVDQFKANQKTSPSEQNLTNLIKLLLCQVILGMRYLDWEMQEAEAPLSGISHLQVIHTLAKFWEQFGHCSLHVPAPGNTTGIFASGLPRIT